MKRQWKKLGCIYSPDSKSRHPKLLTHAANPLPIHIEGDIYRVYYSGRDEYNRSSVGAVDLDIVQNKIIHEHFEPFFLHGDGDTFYSDGVSIGDYYTVNDVTYILFMGWQSPDNGHWRGDIGRLVLNSDFSLSLDSDKPLLGADAVDPVSLSYPWVMERKSGDYIMWYGSTVSWDSGNGEMLHIINYATSHDGQVWDKQGQAVPYEIGVAQAFSKPSVITNSKGQYEMWFSYRNGSGTKYRIGYARSENCIDWEMALDRTGIDVSKTGWDSEMIEYPYVFYHKEQLHLLYNGNGYGLTGFGLAVYE